MDIQARVTGSLDYEMNTPVPGMQLENVVIHANDRDIHGILKPHGNKKHIVLWAGSVFKNSKQQRTSPIALAISDRVASAGISSMLLSYSDYPAQGNDLSRCVQDTKYCLEFLVNIGYEKIILVGHSFSGAVAISASQSNENVIGLITLASQTLGAQTVSHVAPRPLLIIHGLADQTLGPHCGEQIYSWASQPKELILIEGATHRLWDRRDILEPLLVNWIIQKLQ
jgi:pimeloyl-ACP methyl ester carboxylesterase